MSVSLVWITFTVSQNHDSGQSIVKYYNYGVEYRKGPYCQKSNFDVKADLDRKNSSFSPADSFEIENNFCSKVPFYIPRHNYLWLQLKATQTYRCVHTTLRGRMQHTAASPRGKSCSANAANAIMSTWKNNFLQTFFRLQKLWNETGELCLIFFSNWLIPFWNPLLVKCRAALSLMRLTICRSNF